MRGARRAVFLGGFAKSMPGFEARGTRHFVLAAPPPHSDPLPPKRAEEGERERRRRAPQFLHTLVARMEAALRPQSRIPLAIKRSPAAIVSPGEYTRSAGIPTFDCCDSDGTRIG
jgi:hypothetical protein